MKSKTIVQYLIILIFSTALSSCNNKPKEVIVKPSSTTVNGDLQDYISVVDGEYKISKGKNDISLMVKLRVNKKLDGNEFDEINAELLDEHGVPIPNVGKFWISKGLWSAKDDNTKVDQALAKGSGEFYVQLGHTIESTSNDELLKIFSDQAKSFSINTSVKKASITNTNTNTNADDSTMSTSSSGNTGDWNKLLDDYDNFVTEYIAFYKKAMAGDQNAILEYPKLLEKATQLQESLDKAKDGGNLNESQLSRLVEIESKMIQAVTPK